MKATSERLAEALKRARWHQEQEREGAKAAVEAAPLPIRHFSIAISRQAGARGPAIAHRVAERLHWPVYDHELLAAIATEMGLQKKLLASVDEKHQGWIQERMRAICALPTVSGNAYVRHLIPMLLTLASHGDCIIVGRGAAHVLPAETTLRVRLVGPAKERIATIERRFGISHAEASQWVEKTDAERDRFVRDQIQKNPGEPELYDLLINTSRYSDEQCAEMIVMALRALEQQAQRKKAPPQAAAAVGSV